MRFKPYGAQAEALRRSRGREGFGFFMEQGLGKTSTTYADFLEHVAMGDVRRMVTICPNSFKGGWADEVAKHEFPVEPIIWEAGTLSDLKRRVDKGFNKAPNFIINYESIRTENGVEAVKYFMGDRPVFAAADESIQLKTYNSDQTKAALQIAKMAAMTRVLSGKPITQGPHDLWAQMRFIKQLNGKMYFPFKAAFCKMGGFKMKQVTGVQNEEILAELIEPHVFRATKNDWTDLPPKSHTVREYTMSPEMKLMYKSMEEEFVLFLESETVTVDAAITKYIKLAQIQCGFIINENQEVRWLVPPSKNPRLKALMEVIDDEVVGKVTIPYRHKVVFDLLYEELSKKYGPIAYIRGGMSPAEIDAQKHLFNTSRDCRIILLQTQASKYGHTLLGLPEPEHHCSTQIFFENTYSLDDRSQIEDRSHRYGQLGSMMSYIDLVGTSLDRAAIRALQRKESVFQAIFNQFRR